MKHIQKITEDLLDRLAKFPDNWGIDIALAISQAYRMGYKTGYLKNNSHRKGDTHENCPE